MEGQLLVVYLTGVLVLGILAQWLAWRLRLPSILLLLAFGITLGMFIQPDGLLASLTGSDASAGPKLLFPVVSLSVAIILFEGGLTLRVRELKQAGTGVLRLVTLGALISWALASLAAWQILGFHLSISLLLGAILVVTGPTVVGPLLRQIRPARRIGSILKWEGIVIDPIGAILAVLVFEVVFGLHGDPSPLNAVMTLVKTAAIGIGLGILAAWCLIQSVKRYWIPDYLHGVMFLTVGLLVFTMSNVWQHESGLATVTVLGIVLANQKSISVRHIVEFKEHLGVLLISCLFIVLGSRLDPQQLVALGWRGLAFVAVLILLVRPLAVMLSLLGHDLSWRERWFLAFLAPRGIVAAAVSSVFALQLDAFLAHHSESQSFVTQVDQLVPITFLVIVCTVAFYGLTAGPLARWLELADRKAQGLLLAGADPWIVDVARAIQAAGFRVMLVDTNYSHIARARMEGLPAECASILSEQVREDLDLGGIGRLLALTPNDEVNTLAVSELTTIFGRENVYQLAPMDQRSGQRVSVAEHLRGRVLFDAQCNYGAISEMIQQGFAVKTTALTNEFPYEKFRERYGESALVLFKITETKNLAICTDQNGSVPKPGSSVIALVRV